MGRTPRPADERDGSRSASELPGARIPVLLVLAPFGAFLVGLLVGGLAVGLVMGNRPKEKEVVEVAKEAPPDPVKHPVKFRELFAKSKIEPRVGDECRLFIPEEMAVDHDRKKKYPIARNWIAFDELGKNLEGKRLDRLAKMFADGDLYWSEDNFIRVKLVRINKGQGDDLNTADVKIVEGQFRGKDARVLYEQLDVPSQ